ncbi:MAG TPA: S8 family serine peptidase [Syntrophomonadaceae bacterium]|nr:S8 family serine peptidase [Syntrophomonadaceae bacterium]
MKRRFSKWGRALLALGMALVLSVSQPLGSNFLSSAADEASFLNDRAADIIGSSPLQIPGLVVPEGLTGQGIIVGMADSGLDKGTLSDLHPDLKNEQGRIPRVVMLKSYTDRQVPDDPVGHGTHMAATVVGSGQASNGQFKGIAPGASLYFQALLDKEGKISLPTNLKDLFSPAYFAGVRIHVDGWGEGDDSYGARTAQIDNFVFEHPDFLPIFGAGNNGPARASLTSEANSKNALIVGSSQVPRPIFSPEALVADQNAASSSRGPAQGGRIKPDLLAPGSAIISACSSEITSNYASNTVYTQMGGSSMAAAVAGGASALLEEYLKNEAGIKQPSSALLKALLINGARNPDGGVSDGNGFGILDLAGTILPLKEGGFKIADNTQSLSDGQSIEYHFQVSDSSRPFKATLAWIDQAASPDTSSLLLDNLDLEVVDPHGQTLLGNDLQARGIKDRENTVEQVLVNKPAAGEYLIRVRGAGLTGPISPAHLGLVYGQTLKHEVVEKVGPGQSLRLASGIALDLSAYNLKGSLNASQLYSAQGSITAGSDVYIGSGTLYIFSRKLESGGMEIIQENQGSLLVEMNPQVRQGGYFLDDEQIKSPDALFLNGKAVEKVSNIPMGVKVQATLNPRLQTVWSLSAFYRNVDGFIEQGSVDSKEIKLVHDPAVYPLASLTAVSSRDSLSDSPDLDAPYGSLISSGLEMLTPGAKVSMMVSPFNNEVQYINIERNVIMGNVKGIDLQGRQLKMDNGENYRLFTGAKVFKDGQECALQAINPGDKISGVLLDNSGELIEVQAYSHIIYGRVVYFNPQQGVLYLFDHNNRFQMLFFNSQSQVFKDGMQFESAAVNPGEWVRLVLDPKSTLIERVDLAEKKQEDELKIFKSFNNDKQMITTEDGSLYIYNPATQMTKGGYNITPDLLVQGDILKITTLSCPNPWPEFLARAEVQTNQATVVPELTVTASSLNGILIIRGRSDADKVGVYRANGSREVFSVNSDGSFNRIFTLLPGEKNLRIVVLNSQNGGISGKDIDIQPIYQAQITRSFVDIELNPERSSIEKLAEKGILAGFGDGSFRPQQVVNRAEFLTMLGQAKAWKLDEIKSINYFKDNASIPWWALGEVYYANQKGIIGGYPDKRFGPQDPLTRSEMTVIMARLVYPTSKYGDYSTLPYEDRASIPEWARSSYNIFYQKGWLDLFGEKRLQPGKALTRAEAALFIDRLLLPASNQQ